MNVLKRFFFRTALTSIKKTQFPSRPKFTKKLETECEEKFLHGGRGPGGQKINKCNSKVQLKHLPSNIVVTCQETRSREQNRILARKNLANEIDKWLHDGQSHREQVVLDNIRQKKRKKSKRAQTKYLQIQEEKRLEKMKLQEEEENLLKNLFFDSTPTDNQS